VCNIVRSFVCCLLCRLLRNLVYSLARSLVRNLMHSLVYSVVCVWGRGGAILCAILLATLCAALHASLGAASCAIQPQQTLQRQRLHTITTRLHEWNQCFLVRLLRAKVAAGCSSASLAAGFDPDACGASCLACQRQVGVEENSW
jgi:hypothetical protein